MTDFEEKTSNRLTHIEAILPLLATKGDVSDAKSSIVMWLSGAIFAATAIIVSVLAFMLNRAVPMQSNALIVVYPQTIPASALAQPELKGRKP